MQKYTKGILALAGVLIPMLNQMGVPLPDFITIAWVQGVLLALTPIIVFWFPNKDSDLQGSVSRSPAVVAVLAMLLAAMTLSGCEALGVPKAESFNERVGYALGTHTAVLQTATTSLNLGEIISDEAISVVEIADRARSLIDASRRIHDAGDVPGANRQLALAVTILQQLQTHLRGEPT